MVDATQFAQNVKDFVNSPDPWMWLFLLAFVGAGIVMAYWLIMDRKQHIEGAEYD